MNCPNCQSPLLMTERQGVEIDYCGQCRGVWLDRGELDKIIQLSLSQQTMAGSHPAQPAPTAYSTHRSRAQVASTHYRPKKKKSLFTELFEVFD